MDVEKCSFRHHTLSESSASNVSEVLHPQGGASPIMSSNRPHPQASASPGMGGANRGTLRVWPSKPAWEAVYLLPTRVATALLALIQGLFIDYYLIRYNSAYCFAWIAADIAVLLMFAVAFIISYRQMAMVMRRFIISSASSGVGGSSLISPTHGGGASRASPAPEVPEGGMSAACCISALQGEDYQLEKGEIRSAGSMPLVYFAWLVYSALLAVRVVLVYYNFAHKLDDDDMLGTNTLQTTLAASSVVFLLLLLAHHDAAPESRRRHRIDAMTYLVIFDILDAIDLLSVMTLASARASMETWVTYSVLGVACFNLVIPTLPLMALSRTRFGARRLPEFYQTMHRLLVLFVINVPLLATRLLLWHHQHLPVSSFIVKNVIVSFLVFYSFYERDHHQRLKNRVYTQII